MSRRPFCTRAGASVIASRMRCTLGRTRWAAGPAAGARRRPGGAGEVEQVRALGLVELQAARERFEHAFGDAAQVAALHLGVVVDADAGEHRRLFAAQAGDAAGVAEDGQAGLLRGDPRSARGEELADLVPGLHATEGRSGRASLRGTAGTWIKRASHNPRTGGSVAHGPPRDRLA